MERVKIEENNPSLQRIEEKCINCGACLKTCKSLNNFKNEDCVFCGQCILTCPVGALVPKYDYKEVLANLNDEESIVTISISPAVRVAIGDEFGYQPGEFLEKKLVGVLKKLGFSYVFDTTFGADLTIMEEASELLKRLEEKNNLPMFTSCCPSWVLFMEKFYPNDINHLSTCKSPIAMQASIIKNYFAKLKNLNKEDIVSVSLTPCVSKKKEIKKDENNDYVITTSELAMLIRESDIDFNTVEESEFDSILEKGSGAGILFGTSGGVMASALRTAYFLLNGKSAPVDFFHLENSLNKGIKESVVDLGIKKIKVAVIYGLDNVNKMYNDLKKYDFVEVMTCPSGCVGGSGQSLVPVAKLESTINARRESLYNNDKDMKVRCSVFNENVKKVYQDLLEHPLSKKGEELLHQKYENANCKEVL